MICLKLCEVPLKSRYNESNGPTAVGMGRTDVPLHAQVDGLFLEDNPYLHC
jgi:hypothetical protein